MKLKHVIWVIAAIAGVSQLASRTTAQGQDVKAAYDRAESLGRRTEGLALNVPDTPTWIENSTRFWYRKTKGEACRDGWSSCSSTPRRRPRRRRSITRSWPRRLAQRPARRTPPLTLPFTTFRLRGQGAGDRVRRRAAWRRTCRRRRRWWRRTPGRRRTGCRPAGVSLLDRRIYLRARDPERRKDRTRRVPGRAVRAAAAAEAVARAEVRTRNRKFACRPTRSLKF